MQRFQNEATYFEEMPMQALHRKGFRFQIGTYQTNIDHFLHDDLDRVPARILINSLNVINECGR